MEKLTLDDAIDRLAGDEAIPLGERMQLLRRWAGRDPHVVAQEVSERLNRVVRGPERKSNTVFVESAGGTIQSVFADSPGELDVVLVDYMEPDMEGSPFIRSEGEPLEWVDIGKASVFEIDKQKGQEHIDNGLALGVFYSKLNDMASMDDLKGFVDDNPSVERALLSLKGILANDPDGPGIDPIAYAAKCWTGHDQDDVLTDQVGFLVDLGFEVDDRCLDEIDRAVGDVGRHLVMDVAHARKAESDLHLVGASPGAPSAPEAGL